MFSCNDVILDGYFFFIRYLQMEAKQKILNVDYSLKKTYNILFVLSRTSLS